MSRARQMKRVWPVAVALALLAPLGPRFSAQAQEQGAAEAAIELVDPDFLRVCADPHDLPFSNQEGQGFENKIADLLAKKLGKPVAYTYYPNSTGFIRKTLNAHRCDVVMDVPQGDDFVQVTNPYYRASYALVTKKGSDLEGVTTLEDPRLKGKRIGIVAGTPPATNLAVNGLLTNLKSYHLVVDTRFELPAADMMKDLENGDIDVGILWGPIAGNFAKDSKDADAGHAAAQRNDRTEDGLSHGPWRAPFRPGVETHAEQADRRKSARDRQDPRQLWRASARRERQAESVELTAAVPGRARRHLSRERAAPKTGAGAADQSILL